MFLKKLEITGFKSFAQKTVLDFSSSGVLNGGKEIVVEDWKLVLRENKTGHHV